MRRLSIARSLRIALLGLALVLATVAGLGVASLYDARQDYEDRLASAYEVEAAAANLLAAGVIEEAALREDVDPAARAQAAAAFDAAAGQARELAEGDDRSERLIAAQVAAQARARQADEGRGAALAEARRLSGDLSNRQEARRAEAREDARADSRRSVIVVAVAAGLALLAALALVTALIGALRRPLDALVRATRNLASGDLRRRVEPAGPSELRALGEAFNSMAGDLETAHEQIEKERTRLALTVESLGDGLLVAGGDGAIVARNPRAQELVPEIVPGAPATGPEGPLPELERALAGEIEVVHRERTLSITASRLAEPDGGAVWTVRDISDRVALERMKSDFVATASHELRSPLTSIKGFVELLGRSGGLEPRQREWLDIIALSTNRLVDLVGDLLDVARIEAGRIEIHRRPVELGEVVREVTTLMGPRIADKRQDLALDLAPDAPRAYADPLRVRQILTNLMTNAHLYTPERGRLRVTVAENGAGMLALIVADTGRGMTREQIEHVFDRFYRGADEPTPGTGLGLSIVRSLVDLHGGRVEVESEPGAGTTFTVLLPAAPVADDSRDASRVALHGKRVLVVDDEPQVAALISAQLAAFSVETVQAGSGAEAIARLREEQFDAVTLDVLMPGMTGFEVLREVRADPSLRDLPVVIVSVFSGREALAGEWVVSKPIDADELADALGSAVLAGRTRVLVVARAAVRERVGGALDRLGIDHDWATSGSAASVMCADRRYEVALVDAGLDRPETAVEGLELRGRRVRQAVVIFSDGDLVSGIARLAAEPVALEDAAAAVVTALADRPDPVEEP